MDTRTPSRGPRVNKWKVVTVILFGMNLIFAIGFTYYFSSYNDLNTKFGSLQGSYNYLQSEYNSMKSEKESIERWYGLIKADINLRHPFGDDVRKFITPDDPKVKELVLRITGGWESQSDWDECWRDIKKMYEWVNTRIGSSFDSLEPCMPEIGGTLQWTGEFWRFPSETISAKCGDCEDQAVLLTSMILSYTGGKYDVWAITLGGKSFAHMAVAIPVARDKLTVLDPAGNYFTSNLYEGLIVTDIRTALDGWFERWGSDLSIYQIFSNTEYKLFPSTEDILGYKNVEMYTDFEELKVYLTSESNFYTNSTVNIYVQNVGTIDLIIKDIIIDNISYRDWQGVILDTTLPLSLSVSNWRTITITLPIGHSSPRLNDVINSITFRTARGIDYPLVELI